MSRWLHFASISIVFGSAFFWFYAGGRSATACLRSLPVTTRRAIWLLRAGAPIAAVSGLVWLAATIANVTGDPANLFDRDMLRVFFFETPFGGPSLVRLVLLVALSIVAFAPLAPRAVMAAETMTAAALLVSQAWLGHAVEGGSGPYGLMMIASYAIHVVGAAAWVGGLPVLALAVVERRRRDEASYDLLAQYSAMALVAVGLIVLSGIGNTLFHAGGDLRGLASSSYGEILGAKLGLVAAMLVLATVNRFVIMPRLRDRGRIDGATGTLRNSIAVEALLALLVLGAAAVLGITPPPH